MPLVLTRKPGQRVRLKVGDEEVWVSVETVDRNQVRLGFEGDNVNVMREELLLEKGTNHESRDDPGTGRPVRKPR